MKHLELHNILPEARGAVVTLGNFDGVHIGHQHMLETTMVKAQEQGCPSLVIVFEPQPLEYFSSTPPARITHFDEKCEQLAKFNPDYLLCLPFNAELANLSPEAFVQSLFVDTLGVQHVVVGDDFRFGKDRAGDFAGLEALGQAHGFTIQGVGSIMEGGQRVSSTRIREALASGDFPLAASLLNRPYAMAGTVQQGDKRGRQLGYPTANIDPQRRVLPLQGVFAVKVHGLGQQPLLGMANIGTRPTVDGRKTLLEVNIFNFDQDIYGQKLNIEFCHKIRNEQRFESLDALMAQIQADHLAVESYFHHG